MSANSLNRYTPVPPISPTQPVPLDENKMLSKKETKPTQSSDLNISGGAAVFSKPPIIKHQSSINARTTGADGKEKKFSDTDVKTNYTRVETQSTGDAEKVVTSAAVTDAVEHELMPSEEESVVTTKDEDASLMVNGNAATAAAIGDISHDNDDDDDDDDEQSHHVSVSFFLPVY